MGRLEDSRSRGSARWVALTGGLVVAAGAVVWLDLQRGWMQPRSAPATAAAPQQAQVEPVFMPAVDFTHRLSTAPGNSEFLTRLSDRAAASGVTLLAAVLSDQPPTRTQLGRTLISLELHGSYAATKGLLAELASSDDRVTIRSLHMRAEPGAAVLTTTAVVTRWGSPLRDAAFTGGAGPRN